MPKFLIDAQLPRQLVRLFLEFSLEAVHTLDLPDGNRTKDRELVRLSLAEDYIIVTKDNDFVESHLLHGQPRKLLLFSCGNVTNKELAALLSPNLTHIIHEFEMSDFIELSKVDLIIH